MLQKELTKIKIITLLFRHNIKIFLNYSRTAHIDQLKYAFPQYFLAFCLLEEVLLVVHGDRINFLFFVNCVNSM